MTTFSGHKDLIWGLVVTPPAPAASGTTLTVSVATAALLAAVPLPFYATAAPDATLPIHTNAEVVEVTNVVGVTVTMTRAQGGTTAQSIAAGWQFFAGVSSEWADEIEAAINTIESTAIFSGDAAGGDLAGTYPSPTLAAIGAGAGPIGDGTNVAVVTIDAKGRVTGLTSAAISFPSGAPANATYIVQTPDGTLSNEQALSALTTGLLKSTTGTGVVSIAGATDYVSPTLFDANTVLKADSDDTPVALTMGASTILARLAAGNIVAATPAEIVTLIGALSSGSTAGGSLAGTYPNPRFAPGKMQSWLPVSLVAGCLAETAPRFIIKDNLGLLSTGRSSGVTLSVLQGTVCTNLSFVSGTTAANLPLNWWFALVDYSTLRVIRQSTDQLTTAWAANTPKTLALDSVPVTAGARVASSTVTLTVPTLYEALTSLVAIGDSIVVSNASIAAYNGTFVVTNVTATQIQYDCGASATDSISAPFPTVQLAAAKKVYTTAVDQTVICVLMMKATTVISNMACNGLSAAGVPNVVTSCNIESSLTGTCTSPLPTYTSNAGNSVPWAGVT